MHMCYFLLHKKWCRDNIVKHCQLFQVFVGEGFRLHICLRVMPMLLWRRSMEPVLLSDVTEEESISKMIV